MLRLTLTRRKPIRPVKLIEPSYRRDGNAQTITLPLLLKSRANFRGHTRSRKHIRDIKEQRGLTCLLLRSYAKKLPLPLKLTLVRVAPRRLDAHENLPMAFKSVVDGIADWLEVDDRFGFLCRYSQEKASTPNTYGCRVTIEPADGKLPG